MLAAAVINALIVRCRNQMRQEDGSRELAATMAEQQIQVVLIDDDEVDVEAVARLLRKHQLAYDLVTFSNGSDAKNALAGSFGQQLARQPYLILLDLNMPRMNGIELLDWLRAQPSLCRSIVFAFTTSEAQQDCKEAYDRQVAGYLVKSHLGSGYTALARMLDTYTQNILFPPAIPAAV